MPWNDTAREQHNRDGLRYPSDLTDKEWALIAPFIPPARPGGRPRKSDMREVVNAIFSIAGGGIPWRMLPKDFPPVSTVRGYCYAWRNTRLWEQINHVLVMSCRELEGRVASPSAGVIDSQSVKTTESGGVCGYHAGKKIKERKRHIVTDTLGLRLFVIVHAASIQDRDGAPDLLKAAVQGQGDWAFQSGMPPPQSSQTMKKYKLLKSPNMIFGWSLKFSQKERARHVYSTWPTTIFGP